MTFQQAMTVMVRDQALNRYQGGKYSVVKVGHDDYDVSWKDPNGRRFRIDFNLIRAIWGLETLGR